MFDKIVKVRFDVLESFFGAYGVVPYALGEDDEEYKTFDYYRKMMNKTLGVGIRKNGENKEEETTEKGKIEKVIDKVRGESNK
jgi:hypothetical protein